MHVLDALDLAVLAQRGGVEAHLPHHLETRLERGEPFQGGVGANELIVVEQDDAVLVGDRHQRLAEQPFGAGLGGLLLGAQGEGIDIGATEAFQGGDQVGADPLRDEAGVQVGFRIQCPGAAVGAHRHA